MTDDTVIAKVALGRACAVSKYRLAGIVLLRLKVNGYTVRGSNSVSFSFACLGNGGQLLKERICSLRSKFFPLLVDHLLEGFVNQESKPEVAKLVSCIKTVVKH